MTLLLAGALGSASAQTPVLGGEFPVNTYTEDQQIASSIAADHQGNFVITWTDEGQYADIFARRIDANGNPLEAPFPVNAVSSGFQDGSSVGADDSGKFVVVWSDHSAGDGNLQGVFGRRFDATAAPLGPNFPINTYTTSTQFNAKVAVAPSGAFVAVWQSNQQDGSDFGVFGQRFDPAGAPVGAEFAVNTYTTGRQGNPRVAITPSGGFIVVWDGAGQDGSSTGISGRRYDNAGNPSPEFPINTYTTGQQFQADIGVMSDGSFVVAWSTGDGPDFDVAGRRFDSSGNPLGSDFPIGTPAPNVQWFPRIAVDGEDNFIVTWTSHDQDSPTLTNAPEGGNPAVGVYAQRFGPAAQRIGPEFLVNVYTTGDQNGGEIAADENGEFVITWTSYQDGGIRGVYARAMNFPEARPMSVDASASGGASNVNGVLEAGERVVVSPAYRNRSAAGITLPGIASGITGPAGPSYAINDSSASYGTIAPDGTNDCFSAAANCYEVTVTGARPALHWDASLIELLDVNLTLDASKTWSLHVGGSFPDMPAASAFYPFVENLLHNGVTAGGGCGAGLYCPQDGVLRQQMAVFLLKSRYGPGYVPPAATGAVFNDVPASNPFSPWIEELFRQGVTGGCAGGPPPNPASYCPTAVVTRQQMAAFLLKMREGPGYAPPACQALFSDVPCSNNFAPFIEDLYTRQIAAGCSTSPLMYCPANQTTRQQMAAFLVKTYGLSLYGP